MSLALALLAAPAAGGGEGRLPAEIDRRASALTGRVIEWRRDIHQHPELGNQELRTSGIGHDAHVASASGATAEVEIHDGYPITDNDRELARKMAPTLRAVVGEGKLDMEADPILGSEDFSYFQEVVPGLYVLLGNRAAGTPVAGFPSNHSPRFRIEEEERVLELGVRTLSRLAVGYVTLQK